MIFQIFRDGVADIVDGLRRRSVWIALASEDIGDQHKSTTLGPIWLLLNYLLFVGTFVLVFTHADTDRSGYPAYVAIGLFVWFYLAEPIGLGTNLFDRERGFIEGTTLPLFVYVMRLTTQSLIRAAYTLLGCIVILIAVGTPLSIGWMWAILGMILIVFATPAAITVLAFVGAYFPDSQFIVSNILKIGMFLTPIFWYYDDSGGFQHTFYYWNPFTYFIEVVRRPIIEGVFPAQDFRICLTISCVMWILAILLLGKYRKQVVFAL